MKIFICAALTFIAMLLFLPRTGSSEIRNLPLLILILSLLALSVLIRFLKYVILTAKVKKLLKRSGVRQVKIRFYPWASRLRGHYSLAFRHGGKEVQLFLISRKRAYPRYHFDSVDKLEFYRANRIVFNGSKTRGATISRQVEVNRVGRQRLSWDAAAQVRVILFDRLPGQITDSVKREELGADDRICSSDVLILDLDALCKHASAPTATETSEV